MFTYLRMQEVNKISVQEINFYQGISKRVSYYSNIFIKYMCYWKIFNNSVLLHYAFKYNIIVFIVVRKFPNTKSKKKFLTSFLIGKYQISATVLNKEIFLNFCFGKNSYKFCTCPLFVHTSCRREILYDLKDVWYH